MGSTLNPSLALGVTLDFSAANRQMATYARSVENLSVRPLGKISASLSQFDKSLEASNARVLAFGASAGIILGVTKSIRELVSSTIQVEKSLTDINVIMNLSSKGLATFGKELFNIARSTGQSFTTVAEAATEFSRQGLGMEETLKRTSNALILSRLASIDAVSAVESLTSAVNSFNKVGLDSTAIVNKLATVDAAFAVSAADLAEAIKRVGSSASDVGVEFDQLLGLVTAVQQTTSRGGAVIGNALKTIFTRVQRSDVLDQLNTLGIAVRDLNGETLPTIDILQRLANGFNGLEKSTRSQVAELVGGVFQINILKASLADLSKQNGIYKRAVEASAGATDAAAKRNEALNKTFSSTISRFGNNATELGSTVGSEAIKPLQGILQSANSVIEAALRQNSESWVDIILGSLGKGLAKGIGNFLSGPGLVAGFIIMGRLTKKFAGDIIDAVGSLATATREMSAQEKLQEEIARVLEGNSKLVRDVANGTLTVADAERSVLNIIRQQREEKKKLVELNAYMGLNVSETKIGNASALPGGVGLGKSIMGVPGAGNFKMVAPTIPATAATNAAVTAAATTASAAVKAATQAAFVKSTISNQAFGVRDLSKLNRADQTFGSSKRNREVESIVNKQLNRISTAALLGGSDTDLGKRKVNLTQILEKQGINPTQIKVISDLADQRIAENRAILGVEKQLKESIAKELANSRVRVAAPAFTDPTTFQFKKGQDKTDQIAQLRREASLLLGGRKAQDALAAMDQNPAAIAALQDAKATRASNMRKVGFGVGFGLPILGGMAQGAIGDETQGQRRTSSVVGGASDVASMATMGGSVGGPWGAVAGGFFGALKAGADIFNVFNDTFTDLINELKKKAEALAQGHDSVQKYIDLLQKEDAIRSGEVKSTRGEIAQLMREKLLQLQKMTPDARNALRGASLEEAIKFQGLNAIALEQAGTAVSDMERVKLLKENLKYTVTGKGGGPSAIINPFASSPAGATQLGVAYSNREYASNTTVNPDKESQGRLDELAASIASSFNGKQSFLETLDPAFLEKLDKSRPNAEKFQKLFQAKLIQFGNASTLKTFNELFKGLDFPKARAVASTFGTTVFNPKFVEEQAVAGEIIDNSKKDGVAKRLEAARKLNEQTKRMDSDAFKADAQMSMARLIEALNLEQARVEDENSIRFRERSGDNPFAVNAERFNRQKALVAGDLKFSQQEKVDGLKVGFENTVRSALGRARDTVPAILEESVQNGTKMQINDAISRYIKQGPTEDLMADIDADIFQLEEEKARRGGGDDAKMGGVDLVESRLEALKQIREEIYKVVVETDKVESETEKTLKRKTGILEIQQKFAEKDLELSQRLALGGGRNAFGVNSLEQTFANRSLLKASWEFGSMTGEGQALRDEAALANSLGAGLSPEKRERLIAIQAQQIEKNLTGMGLQADPEKIRQSAKEQINEEFINFEKNELTASLELSNAELEQRILAERTGNIQIEARNLATQSQLQRKLMGEAFDKGIVSGAQFRASVVGNNDRAIDDGSYSLKHLGDALTSGMAYGPKDALADLNEVALNLVTDLKSGFKSAFKDFVDGTKTAEEALKDLGISILDKLLTKSIDKGVDALLGSALDIGKRLFSTKANGGLIKGYNTGGMVTGGSGNADDVPAMLTSGEFVIKKSSVRKYGPAFLEQLNQAQGFDMGGIAFNGRNRFLAGSEGKGGPLIGGNGLSSTASSKGFGEKRDVDPRLSIYALTDENNPQNQIRMDTEEAYYAYIKEKYDTKQAQERQMEMYRRGQKQRLQGAYISAAMSVASFGIGVATGAGKPTQNQNPSTGRGTGSPGISEGKSFSFNTNVGLGSGYASGGHIRGYASGGALRDTVPALLMGGEYVINKDAVDRMGTPMLNAINNGTYNGNVARYAEGGLVGDSSSEPASRMNDVLTKLIESNEMLQKSLDNMSKATGGASGAPNGAGGTAAAITNNITISVQVQKDGSVKESSDSSKESAKSGEGENDRNRKMAQQIKGVVLQVIEEQKRPGGALEKAK